MKKIIILITVLTCFFISGCSMQRQRIQSLEDAYFYLLDKRENKEDVEIDDIKNLLKNYELEILDHSEIHDVKGEKLYEYIFTDNNNTSLHVSFIVSNNEETIDFLQYSTDNDNSMLIYYISDNQSNFVLDYKNLDKSIYEKILNKTDELGFSIPKNESSLKDVCSYIVDKRDKGKDVKIDEIKNLLKDYDLKSELTEDDPSIDLKMYDYEFSKNNIEKLIVSTNVESNKESISSISHFIGSYSDSILHLYFSSPIAGEETELYLSYNTVDKTSYEKFYNFINEIK